MSSCSKNMLFVKLTPQSALLIKSETIIIDLIKVKYYTITL